MRARGIIDADVCVVGAGIVGLAHAHEARARGLRVVVVERGARATGASVRNFGHGVISAMADGDALEYALIARERWLSLGGRAGLEVLECGSVVVARERDELEVLESLARDSRRGARLISACKVGELAPIPTDAVIGGMYAKRDIRVDPRQAVALLAGLLEEDPDVRLLWGAAVEDVESGVVKCSRATVRAPLVILCPGPDYATLPAELAPTRDGLTLCKLQMLRVAAPDGRRYFPALLTGLSLLRYPGFTVQPAAKRVRARLIAEVPELVAAGIHLIVVQLPDGDLILGDTHEYGDTVSPFSDERLDRLVLSEACRLLGVRRLRVRERWHGVYATAPGDPFLVERPAPGVSVVEVVAGIGMTTAFGLAVRVLDEAIDDVSARRDGHRTQLRGAQLPSAEARAGCGP